MHEVRAGIARDGEQRVQMRDIVRDSGQHGRHNQSALTPAVTSLPTPAPSGRNGERASSFRASRASCVISEM